MHVYVSTYKHTICSFKTKKEFILSHLYFAIKKLSFFVLRQIKKVKVVAIIGMVLFLLYFDTGGTRYPSTFYLQIKFTYSNWNKMVRNVNFPVKMDFLFPNWIQDSLSKMTRITRETCIYQLKFLKLGTNFINGKISNENLNGLVSRHG